MEANRFTELINKIEKMSSTWMSVDPLDLEHELFDILLDLFRDSLSLVDPVITILSSSPEGLYRINSDNNDIGLKLVRSTGDSQLDEMFFIQTFGTNYFDRRVAFCLEGFKDNLVTIPYHFGPVDVELIDFSRLQAWVKESPEWPESEKSRIQILVKDFSRSIVEAIAQDPSLLESLEWRDMERSLAVACEGLGFQVELTPPAKDGGKDIILRCSILGQSRVYFLEVKHWLTRVGSNVIRDFLTVVVEAQADKGLVLATTGYTANAIEELTQIERRRIRGADKEKIVALCQSYTRVQSGMFYPVVDLPRLLFDETLP